MPGFRELDFKDSYRSGRDNVLAEFYIPVLSRAKSYIRSVGYFSSSAICVASKGIAHFINNGGNLKLLIGAQVYEQDRDALAGTGRIDDAFAERLAKELVPADEISRRRLEVLAWLAKEGRLEVKVAIPIDNEGQPIVSKPGDPTPPYWHLKIGVLRDESGNGIAFNGSVNESATGWAYNEEEITVFPDWDDGRRYYLSKVQDIEEQWNSERTERFLILPLPEAAKQRLLDLAPAAEPFIRDPEEPEPKNKEALRVFLDAAPRLPNNQRLAEETTGVKLQPHQRQVVFRLSDEFPRSWIVADEVGLGKTISSGIALRRLLLSGQVKRALILAPANICVNWQNELFEKFGLWVPRLKDNKLLGVHPRDEQVIPLGQNPFTVAPILIASSHLARLQRHAHFIIDAAKGAPYDLIIVDEAHHARRRASDPHERPNLLLQLLQRLNQEQATQALWLLTATPLQLSALELFDLLLQVGMAKPFDDFAAFHRYYDEINKRDTADWNWLNRALKHSGDGGDLDEQAFLSGLRGHVTYDNIERIRRFGRGLHSPEETALHPSFGEEARAALHRWLRLRGPVERNMTRHTRETLRAYIREGKLNQPLAVRDVQSWKIPFRPEERELYDSLEGLIRRLQDAHGQNTRTGFVLSMYQRRLTSSWAAIEKSLQRRLDKETMVIDSDIEDIEDDEDIVLEGDSAHINQVDAVPLTEAEIAEIRRYIERLNRVRDGDSKYSRLEDCIKEARDSGQAILIFTQFTDTLAYLRDKMVGTYGFRMATYTGEGGRVWQDDKWQSIPKATLVEGVRSGSVQMLLATDAAAEGLNLQACSYLVNYDMPWNPMRAEQRIGRIDRLGQKRPVVTIRNFFVSDAEQDVYRALANRIATFNKFIGGLPPILGVVEPDFISNPLDESRREPESPDLMPMPSYPEAPLNHDEFVRVVRDELGLKLDAANRPVTWQADRASRDPENWRALATFGHPGLEDILRKSARAEPPEPIARSDDPEYGVCVLTRGDRDIPTALQHVDDIYALGDAVGMGDAKRLAESLVCQAVSERSAQYAKARDRQRQGGFEALRTQYVRLVRDLTELRIGLSKSEDVFVLDGISAWNLFVSEARQLGGKTGSLAYLSGLKALFQLTDDQIFAAPLDNARGMPRNRYYQRVQERESEADRLFSAVKRMGQVSATA